MSPTRNVRPATFGRNPGPARKTGPTTAGYGPPPGGTWRRGTRLIPHTLLPRNTPMQRIPCTSAIISH
jgi:hypothetical protein